MTFLTEPAPSPGKAVPLVANISRIVAPNASVTTYHGTNTYLIDHADGLIFVDPGPDDPTHIDAILGANNGSIVAILLTHRHADHYGGCTAIRQATGAPVYAYADSTAAVLAADHALKDGDSVFGMTAIHTPGHAPDHLCFAREDGIVFSGDHVMSWSTTVVSPPRGDMAAYCRSLRKMIERDDLLFLPGHGPPLDNPKAFVLALLTHRETRERQIVSALSHGPMAPELIAQRLYSKSHPVLQQAAERNVLAHLLKLAAEGVAFRDDDLWALASQD